MPTYEYQCDCTKERQKRNLTFREFDQPQICKCGKVMQRLMSVSSFVMKQTGRGMALDTLNGRVLPNKWWKASAEKAAAVGL